MRIAMTVILVALAGAGIFGGVMLLVDSEGGALGLSLDLLPNWYTFDYRWAGLLLLIGFGVAPLVVGLLVLLRSRWAWPAVATLGAALLVWMIAQIVMIGLILPPMQLGFTAIGIVMLVLGILRTRRGPALHSPVRP
jgi:hypothetical protein